MSLLRSVTDLRKGLQDRFADAGVGVLQSGAGWDDVGLQEVADGPRARLRFGPARVAQGSKARRQSDDVTLDRAIIVELGVIKNPNAGPEDQDEALEVARRLRSALLRRPTGSEDQLAELDGRFEWLTETEPKLDRGMYRIDLGFHIIHDEDLRTSDIPNRA